MINQLSKSAPLVSIIIPCYNHSHYLPVAIESVLKQTYSPIEIILVDDGSTDNSREIIEGYALAHPNIKTIFWPVNVGISRNFGSIIDNCTGKYISILEGDDIMYPTKIEKQVQFFEANPDYDVCHHNVRVFDNNTKTYLFTWMDRFLPTKNAEETLFISNWFFKKKIKKSPSASKTFRASYIKN